jgi:MazG family protein
MPDPSVADEKKSQQQQAFDRLCEIVARLRAPGGCPWDREQTHLSILPQLIEEAYEVVEAARSGNVPHFREELGDLLLHVVMHAEIAREAGVFNIEDVTAEIIEKLIRRHPHVFGESEARDTGAVLKQWEAIKHAEKKETHEHYLDSLPTALPALMRAQKAQKKAARMNFDWARLDDVVGKIDEEVREVKEALAGGQEAEIADEIGDLLFAVVNLARKTGSDAESLLQEATSKFVCRFNQVEQELKKQGKELGQAGLTELDAIWDRVKHRPR